VTRYPLEIHIYCICSHVITLSAGSSAPFHEQTRYRSSDLVCGGLVVLLLKFLRKNKKKEKNGPLSLGRSTRGIRACCRQRTAFVSHVSCIMNAFRVRASCVDAKTTFARSEIPGSTTTTRLALNSSLLAKIDLLIRIDIKHVID
jgi:hypothetical protein